MTTEIRISGIVQGVGLRPRIWKFATELGLVGKVSNTGSGVLIIVQGNPNKIDHLIDRLLEHPPRLCQIDKIERLEKNNGTNQYTKFSIDRSRVGKILTQISADSAHCCDCRREIFNKSDRRYRYPFTNCTNCGPRFTIINALPYDRRNTTMREFELCRTCLSEYSDTCDRRFHAQPIACEECGPKLWIEELSDVNRKLNFIGRDEIEVVATRIMSGEIAAIKGLGGFHLACDATNHSVVSKLRTKKGRDDKPFALMARDLDMVSVYCDINDKEAAALQSGNSPIVILNAKKSSPLSPSVSPGLDSLGFMLPYTPLHELIMSQLEIPIVLTSGNRSDVPQVTTNEDAIEKLATIADFALMNNRDISNRIDDSVVRIIDDCVQIYRRGRGYAPAPIKLPPGFESIPDILACGGELKSTFCITKNRSAIVSQHIGDLKNPDNLVEYERNISQLNNLYEFDPHVIAVDMHPDYLSTKHGKASAKSKKLDLVEVQHHHAHLASCMADNQIPRDHEPVLGIILDGLGLGDDNTIWGGEFLLGGYSSYERLGKFSAVPMLGGNKAVLEPWRSTYAHLIMSENWDNLRQTYSHIDIMSFLAAKPLKILDQMLEQKINVPLASSCGRLFDSVAALIGLSREYATYEGQGAIQLEALVDDVLLSSSDSTGYSFNVYCGSESNIPEISAGYLWEQIFADISAKKSSEYIATKFHWGLVDAIIQMVEQIVETSSFNKQSQKKIALSGGCFQNKVLLEKTVLELKRLGLGVLIHQHVPANDGGLSLGQAMIAATNTSK